jgi:hypothetical protein
MQGERCPTAALDIARAVLTSRKREVARLLKRTRLRRRDELPDIPF